MADSVRPWKRASRSAALLPTIHTYVRTTWVWLGCAAKRGQGPEWILLDAPTPHRLSALATSEFCVGAHAHFAFYPGSSAKSLRTPGQSIFSNTTREDRDAKS